MESRDGIFEKTIAINQLLLAPFRHKLLIISLVSVSMLVAALIVSLMDEEYEVIAQVRPGITGYGSQGNELRKLNAAAIRSVLIHRGYLKCLISKPEFSRLKGLPSINAELSPNSDVLTLSLITKTKKNGVKMLEAVLECLNNDELLYGSRLSKSKINTIINNKRLERHRILAEKDNIDKKISALRHQMKQLEASLSQIEENGESLKRMESEVLARIRKAQDVAQTIESDGKQLWMSSESGASARALLLLGTIQQRLEYLARLQENYMRVKQGLMKNASEVQDILSAISELDIKLQDYRYERDVGIDTRLKKIDNELALLKAKLELIRPVEVIMEPVVSPEPLSPNKKLIFPIVLSVSLLFGFLVSLFLEFFSHQS